MSLKNNPDYMADLQGGMSSRAIGRKWSIAYSAVNKHRRQMSIVAPKAEAKPAKAEQAPAAKMEYDIGAGSGWFDNVRSEEPLTDWSHVFEQFKLDPNEFFIVDDTVRMSVWQQSKGLEDGTRDIINLYSYKARFKRVEADQGVSLSEARRMLNGWVPVRAPRMTGEPVGLVVAMADWQLGKGEGTGTAGTLKRLEQSLDGVIGQIDHLRTAGLNVNQLVLANMGEHTEGTHGSYASQPYSVDLNLRDQLQLALETNLHWINTLAPLVEDVQYTATLCNHGTLSRAGGRENITDDADNATGLVGDLLTRICGSDRNLNKVRFNIPRESFITTTQVAGVNLAMAHGHKIGTNLSAWLATQSQKLVHQQRFITEQWLLAHLHHLQVTDHGPYTSIQATTSDPGSKHFEDLTGKYSRTGTTTVVYGRHLPGMWDHLRVV